MDKITEESIVSPSELALILGPTGRTIRQLVEDGILEKVGRGRFLLCDSVHRYIAYKSKEKRNKDDAQIKREKEAADAAYKEAKVKIVEMEVAELQGKLHRSEDVAALTEDLIYTIRGALLSLPGRLAMDTASAKTPAEAAEIIRKEVYALMQELSHYQYDPAKYEERVRQRRDWELDEDEPDENPP